MTADVGTVAAGWRGGLGDGLRYGGLGLLAGQVDQGAVAGGEEEKGEEDSYYSVFTIHHWVVGYFFKLLDFILKISLRKCRCPVNPVKF